MGNVAGEEAEMGGMNGRKAGMEDGSEDADGIEDGHPGSVAGIDANRRTRPTPSASDSPTHRGIRNRRAEK